MCVWCVRARVCVLACGRARVCTYQHHYCAALAFRGWANASQCAAYITVMIIMNNYYYAINNTNYHYYHKYSKYDVLLF